MTDANKAAETILEQLIKKLDPTGKLDLDKIVSEFEAQKRSVRLNCVYDGFSQWKLERSPIEVGRSFIVCASWQREEVRDCGRRIIIIDPGVAFGSNHDTSLLCSAIVEEYWRGGSFLDVGTGTGLQAIIAALLSPSDSKIDAFDVSIDVVEHANINIMLNGLSERIVLKQGHLSEYPSNSYDFVMANLLPSILEVLRDDLIRVLKPSGLLVVSGFANKQQGATYARFDWDLTHSVGKNADAILEMFAPLELVDRRVSDPWAALVLRKAKS
ncbi:MAG: 50S ribosomal protein L11 methyltransferase [Acidobacteriota bacterium]|nr:50S ribosomal protein L11 methyltransferase [Blastocatellia bacterium]MDW8412017.1 50S ribosomal protein L11 methyltransferase [Acidobacteriota bacterium]